jgi:hypothetical protein
LDETHLRAGGIRDQDLIDNHLKRYRRHQPEELKKERRDQYFREQIAIFGDRLQKPGDIKRVADVTKQRAARD